jgi:long-chain acyl-CoA synthetase
MTDQAPLSLDRLFARTLAGPRDGTAVTWQDQTYNWGWVADSAARLKAALAATGAPADLPVSFIPRQRPEAFAAFVGMVAARRSMTMIYSYQTPDAMGGDLRKLRPAILVAHEEDWQAPLIEAAREVGTAGISLMPDGSAVAVPGLEQTGPGEHRPAPHEPSIELLTSGTTGPPKRHPLSFEQFRRGMLDSSFQLGDGQGDQRPFQITVPLANISGIYSTIVAAATGRSIIIQEKFTLPGLLDYVRKWRPGNIGGPPALVKMILDADVPKEDLAGVRFLSMGMGPVDPEIRRQFEARYQIPILPCYGATEFVGAATALSMDDYHKYGEAKFGSVGRPVAGGAIRIRDQETGEIMPLGEANVGLVEVLLPTVEPDWIKTTDLGCLDSDGFLYLKGRADGVIIRGGFKIHPSAIETALLQHPAVAACSVVGLPDERLGHVPVAAVEPKPDCPRPTEAELDTWLRQRLPKTNIPTQYRIVDELPRTPSLKVQLNAVKQLFAA